MLLITLTCFHVIVGNQKAKLVREDTHEAFLFKSHRTIKLVQLIVSLILENKEFTFNRAIKIKL